MEHFRASFREAWFTDTGGVRTQRGDKILYETNIPADQIAEGYILPVWIVATIKETNGDQVWLDDVEVLNGFKNKEWNKLVIDHANDVANKFQGHKAIKLTRNENWFVFPQGKEMDVTDYINKYGHGALTSALVFHQQILPFPNTPSRLPLFILNEKEINPKELLKRLREMSEARSFKEVLRKLAEQNTINKDVTKEPEENKQGLIPPYWQR